MSRDLTLNEKREKLKIFNFVYHVTNFDQNFTLEFFKEIYSGFIKITI